MTTAHTDATVSDYDDTDAYEVELHLDYQWRRAQHGDITAILTWNWGHESGPDACLVLCPTYHDPRGSGGVGLVVIDRRDLWKWSRDHNDDSVMVEVDGTEFEVSGDQWQRECAAHVARKIGITDSPPNTIRIRGIIEDAIGDLLTMPPAPQLATPDNPAATFDVTDLTTGKTTQRSVTRF